MDTPEKCLNLLLVNFAEYLKDTHLVRLDTLSLFLMRLEKVFIAHNIRERMQEEDLEEIINLIKKLYKEKRKRLSNKESDVLLNHLNALLYALDLYPLRRDGRALTLEEWEEWASNILHPHRKKLRKLPTNPTIKKANGDLLNEYKLYKTQSSDSVRDILKKGFIVDDTPIQTTLTSQNMLIWEAMILNEGEKPLLIGVEEGEEIDLPKIISLVRMAIIDPEGFLETREQYILDKDL